MATALQMAIQSKQGQLGLHRPMAPFPLTEVEGYLQGVCFHTVWMWLFLRQRGDMETGQVPHSSFLGQAKQWL